MISINNVFYKRVFFIIVLLFVLFIQGAIPFYALPTLGQAIWTTGFSQSFINSSVLSIYATNFGQPQPAAMAFGLAGAWPIGLFIKLGLHPADAYSTIAGLWFSLAYFSAYKIGRFFGGGAVLSTLMAGLWLTMPIIWSHAAYSMVSWGIALLSFYYYRTIKILFNNSFFNLKSICCALSYFISVIISIFMDGYSFVMFAIGSSILIVYTFIFIPMYRRNILFIAAPTHFISLLFAYFMYVFYIGRSSFNPPPIDFFRGWGLDLSFIAVPSKGVLWLFDILGLSISRSNELYFGDMSVWTTTFSLPIILAGIFSWWYTRRVSKLSSGLLVVAILSFYMSLGPSLKINTTRSVDVLQSTPKDMSPLMPTELGIMPTGTQWVSEHLPGFNSMRASYRWSALGIFAYWLLFSLYLGKKKFQKDSVLISIVLVMIVANLPNLYQIGKEHNVYRKMFIEIDSELVNKLSYAINSNELIAFLPYQNDFIINYLASKLNILTYNIGGDKNFEEAQKYWPSNMLDSSINLHDKIFNMLLYGDASAIVIPYFNTLWSAHFWPCLNKGSTQYLTTIRLNDFKSIKGFRCPTEIKKEFSHLMASLKKSPYLSIDNTEFFAVVRLDQEMLAREGLTDIKSKVMKDSLSTVTYPIVIQSEIKGGGFILYNWNSIEKDAVWSKGISTLNLPVPNKCRVNKCSISLSFGLLNANPVNPVTVKFSMKNNNSHWYSDLAFTQASLNESLIPLPTDSDSLAITIEVIGATSPKELGINSDERILGIRLYRIDLMQE